MSGDKAGDWTLEFDEGVRIGRVAGVDTSRVNIDVDNHELLTRVCVSNLVAVEGTSSHEYLIGMVERITRAVREEAVLEEEDAEGRIPIAEVQADIARIVLVGTYRAMEGVRRNVFKRGADSFPQIDRRCYLVEAGNLQRLMNLLGQELPTDQRLRLGSYVADRTAGAVADGNRFFQRHACVLGSTGSGKSWSVALILERANALNYPNLIVLDMHGEYAPLADDSGTPPGFAQGFRVAGPGDLKSPGDNVLFLPYWLLNREEMLAMLLDRSEENAPNQAARFTVHVRELREKTLADLDKTDVRATFTVDSPIPYPKEELVARLQNDDIERVEGAKKGTDKKGEWNGKLTRFISRLRAKMEDRRYGFLFDPPKGAMEYEWLAAQAMKLMHSCDECPGIKIIDFSEVPSDVLPVIVGVFARLLYDIQFWMDNEARTPISLVCDEAHLYLPVKAAADAVGLRAVQTFERIAKEGRKYGFSLLVISQRPSDVSRTILSQCNNFLVLRLTNDSDQQVVRRLMPDSMAGLVDALPLLDVGEALLLGDAVLLPARIKLDPPSIVPSSATRDFWSEWCARQPTPDGIRAAVEALRRQTRAAPPVPASKATCRAEGGEAPKGRRSKTKGSAKKAKKSKRKQTGRQARK